MVSLKVSHRFEMNYIRIQDADEQGGGVRMVNGEIQHDQRVAIAPGADDPL